MPSQQGSRWTAGGCSTPLTVLVWSFSGSHPPPSWCFSFSTYKIVIVSVPASQDSRKGRAAALLQGQLPRTGYAVCGTFIWLFTQRSLLSLSAQIPGVMPTSLGVGAGGSMGTPGPHNYPPCTLSTGCGHCKKMKPEFESAAEVLHADADVSFLA